MSAANPSRRVKRECGAARLSSRQPAAAPATVSECGPPTRHCRDARSKARSDGKAGGQDSRARRPACDRVVRAPPGARDPRRTAPTLRVGAVRSPSPCGVARHPRSSRHGSSLVSDRRRWRRNVVPSALVRRLLRHAGYVTSALALSAPSAMAQIAPPSVVYDSYAVTAARGSQPIADVLADVTVIGAAEIARAGAQSVTELLQRQPGVEITQNGGPGSLSGIFLRGAQPGPDAGADRRHPDRVVERRRDVARGDSARPDRPDRDPARAGVEPLRRGRHRRRRAGVHPARDREPRPATRARAMARTAPGTSRAGCPARPGRSRSRCRARRRRATASTPSSIRRASCSTATRTATRTRASRPTLGFTAAPGQEFTAQYLPQPSRQSVRRRTGLRRSDDHRRRDVAGRVPQRARAVLGVAAVGGRRDRRQQDGVGVRRFPVQDDAAAVRVAERIHAAARAC